MQEDAQAQSEGTQKGSPDEVMSQLRPKGLRCQPQTGILFQTNGTWKAPEANEQTVFKALKVAEFA